MKRLISRAALICVAGLLAGCPTGIDLDVQLSGFAPEDSFIMAIAVAGYDVNDDFVNEDDIHVRCYTDADPPGSIGIHSGEHYDRHVAVLAQLRFGPGEFFVHRTLGFSAGERVSADLYISHDCVTVACGDPPACTSEPTPACDESAAPFPSGYEPLAECDWP